ncbi:hypothetical protein [Streptomyces sp. NPDC099088]|uniref:hypothetical protein n=1 Tax=Streptomyces sp. NPDC099088 TaxID=3366101 RepID=UPI00381EC516
MGAEDSEHMKAIRHWLAGEVVNNTVGIKLTGSPFNGRTKIVQLDQDVLPPSCLHARGGRGQGPWNPAAWHIYTPVRSPDAAGGWIYEHTGDDTATDN